MGQHTRYLSNCQMHFLPPVSGGEASNNAVRAHKPQTAKRVGRSSFVLFLENVLWNWKKKGGGAVDSLHTRWMKIRRGPILILERKMMRRMFKEGGKSRGGAVDGCSIVAFRHVWRPKKREDFRTELEGKVGGGLLPGPFEAGQISNTALATSLAWNPHFCHRLAGAAPHLTFTETSPPLHLQPRQPQKAP